MNKKTCILHVSDWNMEDRYYRLPVSVLREFISILREFINKIKTKTAIDESWNWFLKAVKRFNKMEVDSSFRTDRQLVRRLKRISVTDLENAYFLDYLNPGECVLEIERELKEEEKRHE